jgi:hypothetical protein
MKILTLLAMVLFLALTATGISAGTGDVYLRQMEGDVLLKIEGNADWVPASINTPLQEGDRIWVADDGRGELRFRDGSVLRLDRHTSLDILGREGDGPLFHLGIGRAYVLYRGDKNRPGLPEYRHTRLRNAVVYLSKDDFLKGRRGPFESQENPFLNRSTIPGPPRITPIKAIAMPVVKEIPSAKLPPLNVRNGQARENGWARPASRTLSPPGVSGATVALRPGTGNGAVNPGKVTSVQGGPSAAMEKAKPKTGSDVGRLAGFTAREVTGKRDMVDTKPRSQEIMGKKPDVRPAVAQRRAVREAPLLSTPVRPANNEVAQGRAVQRDTREPYRKEVPDVQRQKIGESLNQRAATSPKEPVVRYVTVKAAEGVRADMQRPAPMVARTSERRPAIPNADYQSVRTATATGGR